MSNLDNNLNGMRIVATGFMIFAVASFALQIVRIFKHITLVEYGFVAATIVAWLMIFVGGRALVATGNLWKKVMVLAPVVVIFAVLEGLAAFKNMKNGLQEQGFIDIRVMFFLYLTIMGLFYGYRVVMKNTAYLTKGMDPDFARRCIKSYKPACAITMAALIIVPLFGLFPKIVEYIGGGGFALIGLLAQAYMCKLIFEGYDLLVGNER